eukprot:g15121.t4
MTSLDKLAKMDGWDVGEDDAGESAAPATTERQPGLGDDAGSKPKARISGDDNDQPPRGLDRDAQKTTPLDHSSLKHEPRQAADFYVDDSSTTTRRATAGLGFSYQERIQTVVADGGAISGIDGTALDKPAGTHPATERTSLARPGSATHKIWGAPLRHPLDTLRKKGCGSESGGRNGVVVAGGTSTADEIAKLRAALKRTQEEAARERGHREVCEEQARVAYASLEAETKRAVELDNRVRVAELTMSMGTSIKNNGARGGRPGRGGALDDDGGGGTGSGGVSSKINTWERRARSLSPVRKGATTADNAEMIETQAQMAVLAEATNEAREEAQSALDTVEGFAELNRKLVAELRAAISARDDLFKDLSIERGLREQLEEDVTELLESGFIAEMTQKQGELEARCAREQEEAARVAAMHARMEEEYRLALGSADQERARLEETIVSLEGKLEEERHAQAVRAKEAAERAAMGSEEVLSVRAGLHSRSKRRGQDRVNLRQSSRNLVTPGGRGGCSTANNNWLVATQGPRNVQSRAPPQHQKSTSHGGGVERRSKGDNQPHQRSVSAVFETVAGSRVGGGGASSIGVAGTPGGDGSAGHAVHAAAVESVEVFLGDFVPKVAQPPAVSTLLSAGAEEKGAAGAGGSTGVGGAVANKLSKWAAIGRGGKISARAAAVCVEEATKAAEAAANNRLRSLTNASARALSVSWFSLLARAATGAAAHGDRGHGGPGNEHAGSGAGRAAAPVDSTVPVIAVRRLVQSCGILQGTAGGPTLAHADMELQRNAVGKGGRSIGHREFFKVILALAQYRFSGEPKDEALEKLSRMLRPTQAGPGVPHFPNRQTHVATLAAKPGPGSAEATPDAKTNSASPGGNGTEEDLAGAERVLERDRRALEAIFSNYSDGSQLLFAALASFCKDFELTPGLISRDDAHRIYVQLAYPNETLLTPKLLAAREGPHGRREAAAARNGADRAVPAAGSGLTLGQWMTWLGLAAVGCTWFDKQRGLYNTPTKKVLGLLQWMEGSVGKRRIGSKRGAAIVPAFNLLPV